MTREYTDIPELIAALRRCDARAMREFFDLFVPLLSDSATRLGVPADRRGETVMTVLDDVLLAIVDGRCDPQPDVAGYLVVSLRNHVFLEARRDRRRLNGVDELALDEEVLLLSSVDAESVQGAPSKSAGGILADVYQIVLARFSESDRDLIAFAIERVPAREVAGWLRIEHGAAKMRIHRAARRLRRGIIDEVALLPPKERSSAERLLRRAGIGVARQQDVAKSKVAEVSQSEAYPGADRTREVS